MLSLFVSRVFTRAGILFMKVLATLPLSVVRTMGSGLGWLLYGVVLPRRRVVETNLLLCFPELTTEQRRRLTRQTFIFFAQAWLDRSWLWHAPDAGTLCHP